MGWGLLWEEVRWFGPTGRDQTYVPQGEPTFRRGGGAQGLGRNVGVLGAGVGRVRWWCWNGWFGGCGLSLSRALPFGLPLGCLLLIKSRGSKSVEVQRVWEVYDERLQFMSLQDAQRLSESLDADGVSCAWLVWSGAAERLLLLTLIGSVVVLSLAGVWFLGVVVLCFGLFGLVVTRCGRFVTMFLMLLMVLVFSCIVTLPLPHCLTCDVPGRIIGNMLGWSLEEKNVMGSGVWLFRGALQGKESFFLPLT